MRRLRAKRCNKRGRSWQNLKRLTGSRGLIYGDANRRDLPRRERGRQKRAKCKAKGPEFSGPRLGVSMTIVGVNAWRLIQSDRSRSEEHTSELQSLMRISYAVFC